MGSYHPTGAPYISASPSHLPPGTAVGSSFKTRYFQNGSSVPRTPQDQSSASSSRQNWRDYMLSLDSSMSRLDLVKAGHDKPLPDLPGPEEVNSIYRPSSLPPPPPARYYPTADQYYAAPAGSPAGPSPQPYKQQPPKVVLQSRPHTAYGTYSAPSEDSNESTRLSTRPAPLHPHQPKPTASTPPSSPAHRVAPPKTFRPSFHPMSTPSPTRLAPPPIVHTYSAPTPQGKGKSREDPIILDGGPPSPCTPRRRVKSSIELDSANVTIRTPPRKSAGASPSPVPSPSSAQRCAGTTRQGLPCKRLVKVSAPWVDLAGVLGGEDDEHPRMRGRYCKDHAGQICGVEGFYWKSTWVQFDDWIPRTLGQQTQALLRMAMESALTPGECPGFIYAYELRDLATDELAFFKVGRTDNVPRRIGQWTTQCSSHTPTLRDIFPLASSSSLDHAPGSLLPGVTDGGTIGRRMSGAVKRLERLIHLELAERSPVARLLDPCKDCGSVHKEIFPLSQVHHGHRTYEEVVKEVICRWERYIRVVCMARV